MNTTDKRLLKIDVMVAYGQFIKPLYLKYKKYTNNEVRLEVMKIIMSHIMYKTSQALYKKIRIKAAKKQRRIKEKEKKIEDNFEKNNEKLFEELLEN